MTCKCTKPLKREKWQNKVLFLWRQPLDFLPKRPKNGSFLLSVRFFGRSHLVFDLDGEEFIWMSPNALFWAKI
jgi:hypothetical protein